MTGADMPLEAIALTGELVTKPVEMQVTQTDYIMFAGWIIVSIALIIYFFFKNKGKKKTFVNAFKSAAPGICVIYVFIHFSAFFYDGRFDPITILTVLTYFLCVWSITTLLTGSVFYAKASMEGDDHPQKTAISKAWPWGFVVMTVFSLVSVLIHIIF